MEKIIKSRETLSSVISELSVLKEKLNELSSLDLTAAFVPVDLCTSAAMTLQKVSAYEQSLFEKLSEFSDTQALTIADVEKIISEAEKEEERKLLAKRFSGIKSKNPKYDALLQQLKESACVVGEASDDRTIAELIISDITNHTYEISKSELVENSNYYKLAFALNRNELIYDNSEGASDGENSGSGSNEAGNENPPAEDKESEPPPEEQPKEDYEVPAEAEQSSPAPEPQEVIPIIELERKEDFADEQQSAAAEKPDFEKLSEEIRPIAEEYQDKFALNPNELKMGISESPEVNTKHNVTEIINILSPKGKNARQPVKIFHVILSELLLYGPKTESDIYELPDFLKNRISNSVVEVYLQKLYNKGLISRIEFDGTILYYFTKKGLKFNTHDRMISNFYCSSDKRSRSSINKRDCRKVYPISNMSVCSAVILSRIVKRYPYYLAIGSSDISVEGLSISVISKPGIRNFALSYVSDNSLNLDRLYDNLNKSLNALNVFDKLSTMIVGSFTCEQAQAVYKVVIKSWSEKLTGTRIVLYSYTDDKYFYPDTLEEITDMSELEDQLPADMPQITDFEQVSTSISNEDENEPEIELELEIEPPAPNEEELNIDDSSEPAKENEAGADE